MPKDLSAATRAQVVAAVGQGRSVLDVGGSVGADARVLAERECAVTALRTGAPLGAPPEPSLLRSVEVDGALDLAAALGADAAFDVVIIGDELARAADPAELVRAALEHVRPDGTLILSVPNVTQGSVRLALRAGRWEPGRTAARHRFSRATLVRLVQDAGLEVAELRATTADALAGPVDVPDDDLPPSTVQWVRAQPEAAYAHYVLSARRPPSGRPPRTDVPAVVPDAAAEPVHDRYAQAVEAAETRTQELRHRLLTQRDHIIGLEATAARATAELARVRRAGEREIAEMRATTTWRAGRLAVAPVAAVRKALGGQP